MAALVAIVLSFPRQEANPVLGSDWTCSHTAFLTSCTRVAPALERQGLQSGPRPFRRL
jgi:hypothetical protein